ncbi:MAG: hypothetical protein VX265_03115 [Myxococcota bacterium]|nr:hypothetical protein [Myxococcota bacterium]
MRIALASCADLPDWEVDDRPLHAALRARGVALEVLPWDATGVDWGTFDAVLVRTTWDYQDRPAAFLAWAGTVGPRLHNPASVIRWNLDKRYLRSLVARGVPVAPTVWLEPGASVDLGAVLDARGWRAGFLKPVIGASARATHRFSRGEAAAAQDWLTPVLAAEAMMLQPYLPAVEGFGEVSAICVEGEARHWVRKVPVPGDYRVQDDYGASDEPFLPTAEDEGLAARVLAAAGAELDLDGPLLYARVDLLRDAAGAWVVTELELVEPSLFLRHGPSTADILAEALMARAAGA